jgi:asparagine synthase (glutamine-hydrolysing)
MRPAICGLVVTQAREPVDVEAKRLLEVSGYAPGTIVVRTFESRGLYCALAASAESLLAEQHGVTVLFTGHPRPSAHNGLASEPGAIAASIAREGARSVVTIAGDFALLAWDARRSEGFGAVDRIGVRNLYYATIDGGLVFASSLDVLGQHPRVDRAIDPQSLYDYVYYHVCPGPATIYRAARRLAPGHVLAFGSAAATVSPRRYWQMNFTEDRSVALAELERRFVEEVQRAVAIAADGTVTGAFLSGGTDSSTVSGMLGRITGRPAPAFSIGFDAAGYDEMQYARVAARHFGCDHHEYYVTPADVVEAAPKIASFHEQPFGNASVVPAYYCAKLARECGVRRLLAGDGGDELFGGNERYAKLQVLAWYERLPGLLRHALIEPLVLKTPLFRSLPIARKAYRYVEQAALPMPWRYEAHNLLTHLGADRVFEPEFLAQVDRRHPLLLLEQAHAPYAESSLINQALGIDLRFTLADSDLPKVTGACDLAGIDVAFPLLDDRIVDFSATLPTELKLRGTRLRWFFKHALRDFLPREVLEKSKHGFGLPVGAWLTTHRPLLDLASDAVGELRARRIVRAGFLDELSKTLLRAHPAYYGTMLWVLMMLGLWMHSRHR